MKFYTPDEIAKLLNINYRKILDMIAMGKLPALKIGGSYRITETGLRSFLEKCEVKAVKY